MSRRVCVEVREQLGDSPLSPSSMWVLGDQIQVSLLTEAPHQPHAFHLESKNLPLLPTR